MQCDHRQDVEHAYWIHDPSHDPYVESGSGFRSRNERAL
jgi:hypothetical protein